MPTYADSSIYNLIRPQQPLPDPIQEYGGMVQLKNLIRADKDTEAANAAWAQSGGDMTKFSQLLSQTGGSYKSAIEAQKAGLDARKTTGEIENKKLDSLTKTAAIWRDAIAGTNDDAGMLRLNEVRASLFGPDAAAKMPPLPVKFDPAWQQANVQRGEDIIKKLEGDRNRAVQIRGQEKPAQITDAAGNVTFVNPYTGATVKELGGVGKPTATHEKTVAANKKLSLNLDEAITELEKATADGGLIDKSTGSGIGAGVDWAASLVGKATPGSIAVGAMKPIFDLVLKMVPRFEGPQSDKDTQTYKEAAGELANPNVPNERKKIAGREILRLMKARKGEFISKDVEGTELDTKPVVPSVAPGAGGSPNREAIDAELRRRGVIR